MEGGGKAKRRNEEIEKTIGISFIAVVWFCVLLLLASLTLPHSNSNTQNHTTAVSWVF